MLGGPTQDVECLFGRDALTLHEDAHGLTDRLAARQGGVEVGRPALLVLMGAGEGEGEAGHRHQDRRLGPVHDAERGGVAGVEIEGPELRIRREGQGEHAPYPGPGCLGGEIGPAEVVVQVLGIEDEPLGNGIEAGPLVGLVLEGVDLDDQRIGVHRGGDDAGVDEEEPGAVAPLNGRDGQIDHAEQGVGDAAGCEQAPGRLREAEGELGEGVPGDCGWSRSGWSFPGWSFGHFHAAAPAHPVHGLTAYPTQPYEELGESGDHALGMVVEPGFSDASRSRGPGRHGGGAPCSKTPHTPDQGKAHVTGSLAGGQLPPLRGESCP